MYAHLITCTGWTWEYIDDFMTVPRLKSLNLYWKIRPPVHVSVAGYLGIGKEEEKAAAVDGKGRTQEQRDAETAEFLLANFPMKGLSRG